MFKALATIATAASCAVFATAVAVAPVTASPRDLLVGLLALTVLGVIAENLFVEFSDRVTMTAANLPILLAVMFLGSWPAMVVAAAAGAWGCWRERSVFIALFNEANFVLASFAAAMAYWACKGAWGFSTDAITVELLVAGVVAGSAFEAANLGVLGFGNAFVYQRSVNVYFKEELPPFVRSLAVLTGLGLMTAALYAEAGVVAVVLLFLPLFASQYMFKLLAREKEHVQRQRQLTDQYLEMNIGLAAAMVVLLDSKDEYTAQHSAAVAMYCRDIAVALNLPEQEAEALHLAGLLHDLGKVGTPDAVLNKTTNLDEDDWSYIKEHPSKGAEVLSHLAAYQDVADIVLYHHERLDGSGYPGGVKADRIPEMSKVLAIADSYHAMTSDRPYRPARSSFEALKELRSCAGVTLDQRYVEVFARVLRDKDLAYREGTATDFMGEYERGRINLRLRGTILTDLGVLSEAREDPAAG